MRALLLGILLSISTLAAGEAELRFTSTTVEVRPQPEDESTQAIWRFTNRSTQAVRFTPLPCRCSELRVAPNPCPAGATGTVTAVVPIGEQAGRYERAMRLATDLPGASELSLTLVLHLPPAPSIVPTFVRWDQDGAATARSVAVTMPAEAAITIVRAEPTDARLRADLVPGDRPRSWTLVITPTGTHEPFNARVDLISDDGRHFRVYARVL